MKKIVLILLLVLSPSLGFSAGNPEKGKELYSKRCWWCHGEDGDGGGPAGEFLNPPPRDFTAGSYKWKTTPFDEITPTDEDFMKMIKGAGAHNSMGGWTGMSGTSMPGWADMLSDQDAADLIAYIKQFAELGNPEKPAISYSGKIKSSAESIEKGKELFKDRCSECHGEEGRGNGTKKLKDDWGFRTWPRNLTKAWTFRVSNKVEDIYTRMTVSIAGTQMPSFADPNSKKTLTEEERWHVANYVNTLDSAYKKPGDNTVVKAMRIGGDVPESIDDPVWENAKYTGFYFIPQIVAEQRLFTPSLDSISVKALYNDKDMALLLEWDDRTKSLPGDKKAMEIADGEVFVDGVSVEFPLGVSTEGEKPYFGMGDAALPVNMWYWQSEAQEGASQTFTVFNSKGIKDREKRDPNEIGIKAFGAYDKGTWRVVMKRPLKTTDAAKDIQFEEGRFTPIAFAAWDGSNRDKGSKHVMTTWYWILLEPSAGVGVYLLPIVVALLIFGAEMLWLRSARGK